MLGEPGAALLVSSYPELAPAVALNQPEARDAVAEVLAALHGNPYSLL